MIDLYFQTSSKDAFEEDFKALGLLREVEGPSGPGLVPADEHVAIDYIGRLVDTPPVLDTSAWPPTVISPAVFYPQEFANVRLTGPDAEERATLIAFYAQSDSSLILLDEPSNPKRRWA